MAAEARKGSIDSYDEDSATQTVHSPLQNEGHDATSPGGSTSGTSPLGLPKVPPSMPKRRRVTRACDECRRKKIKCDGKRPCQHCTAYSYGTSLCWPCLVSAYADMLQIAPLISLPTGEGTRRRRTTFKLSKLGCDGPRPSYAPSCLTWT